MPTYDFACPECGAVWERERPMAEAATADPCPVCESPGQRRWTMPKLLFKADPRDVRPVWHNHDVSGQILRRLAGLTWEERLAALADRAGPAPVPDAQGPVSCGLVGGARGRGTVQRICAA